MDDYLVKGASLASARRPETQVNVPSKSQGYMASADQAASLSKPTIPQKLQSIIGHTQNLKNTTQVLRANTEALEANTKALLANTEALQTNVRAAQTNKHARAEQMHQGTPVPPAPKVPVYSPSALASKPAAAAKVPVAAVAPKMQLKPQPAPMPKEMLKPQMPMVSALAKTPIKPVEPAAENGRMVSTMPLAAAPVKTTRPAVIPVENGRTISTMPVANTVRIVPTVETANKPVAKPADMNRNAMTAMSMVAAAPSKPATVAKPTAVTTMPLPKPAQLPVASQPKAPVAQPVKMSDVVKYSKTAKLNDLMQLPLMDKMYDCKISNPKYYPVAAKTGLKHGDVVTTQGYVQVVATEDSGKVNESYYLQLTVNTEKGDSCFIVKVPSEQVASMGGKESADHAKKTVREMVKGRVPCTGGNIIRKPVYVTVTGQLAYNGTHAATMRSAKVAYQGKRDMNSYTAWEINASNVTFATPQ
jgi:hypothetical protein